MDTAERGQLQAVRDNGAQQTDGEAEQQDLRLEQACAASAIDGPARASAPTTLAMASPESPGQRLPVSR